jgi:hypothetical protein
MKKTYLWAILILLAASLACNLPFFSSSADESPDDLAASLPEEVDVEIADASLLEPVPMSGAQRQLLLAKGSPNRFTLMFSDGMREETWYYDHLGYEVTFRNGEIFTEDNSADPVDAVDFVTIYYPWQFNAEMGLGGLLQVAEVDTFAMESLEDAFQEDVSLVYLKGLDAGLRGEDLLFVRTIPVGEGARTFDIPVSQPTSQSAPDDGLNLTASEAAHLGAHSYSVYCLYSDGLDDEYSDDKVWEFTDEGLLVDNSYTLPKISENFYGHDDEEGGYYVNFHEGDVTITGGFLEEDDSGHMVQIDFTCVLTPVD